MISVPGCLCDFCAAEVLCAACGGKVCDSSGGGFCDYCWVGRLLTKAPSLLHGLCMICAWILHGFCMYLHGLCMDFAWILDAFCMDVVRNVHGRCMASARILN